MTFTNTTLNPTINTVTGFLSYLNVQSNGLLGVSITVVMWATIFFALKAYETEKALVASLFPMSIIAWSFYGVGLLSQWWAMAYTVGLLLSMFMFWVGKHD